MADELDIVRRHRPRQSRQDREPHRSAQNLKARQALYKIYMDEKIEQYIVSLVSATRQPADFGLPGLTPHIQYGASPRASLYLSQASRAHAFLRRRGYVAPEDVQAVALDVLRHRLILTYEAEAEEITQDEIVQKILEKVEIP
jgi:MoxR-like ATPase